MKKLFIVIILLLQLNTCYATTWVKYNSNTVGDWFMDIDSINITDKYIELKTKVNYLTTNINKAADSNIRIKKDLFFCITSLNIYQRDGKIFSDNNINCEYEKIDSKLKETPIYILWEYFFISHQASQEKSSGY